MKSLRWLILAALVAAWPAQAFWQSRDSNYNAAISTTPAGITATNIGTNSVFGDAATLSVTVPAGGVPAGALIVVGVDEYGTGISIGGSVADTHNTPYTCLAGQNNWTGITWGFSNICYFWNATALTSGNTITFTLSAGTGRRAVMTAFYATGIMTSGNPLDAAVSVGTTGISSANPLVTLQSGTPGQSGELFVSMVGSSPGSGGAAGGWFGQDTTDGWAAPFTSIYDGGSSAYAEVDGGSQVNAGTGKINWKPGNPGSATNITYSAWVIGFKHLSGWTHGINYPLSLLGTIPSPTVTLPAPNLIPSPTSFFSLTAAPISSKKVFAHYMVCCGSFGGQLGGIAGAEQDIIMAQSMGIQGFVLNLGDWNSGYQAAVASMFAAAAALNSNFTLFISADMTSLTYTQIISQNTFQIRQSAKFRPALARQTRTIC